MSERTQSMSWAQAVRGVTRLTIDAVGQTTSLVEAIHAHASRLPTFGVAEQEGPRPGLIGRLVYESIRRASGGVGWGIDLALAPFAALPRTGMPTPAEDAVLAAVNGVVGDHLVATGNPLALDMTLRHDGRALVLDEAALRRAIPQAGSRLVVLVHGLCMSDRQWHRDGHDHGAALARDLGYTPVYARYNSGRHVSVNGRELAGRLEQLVRCWPVAVRELAILGHSMGGLVARSACHYGAEARHAWRALVRHMVFLATPHHGAPLERGGSRLQALVGRTPYAAPLARLGMIRSAGITDLRYGNVVDEDWADGDRFGTSGDRRRHTPLPEEVGCYALATSLGARPGDMKDRLLGDGLVPRPSALGKHPEAARSLAFPAHRRWVGFGMNHLHALDRPVYERIRTWLAGSAPEDAGAE